MPLIIKNCTEFAYLLTDSTPGALVRNYKIRVTFCTDNRIFRAAFRTHRASCTQFHIDIIGAQFPAHIRLAMAVKYMFLELLPEMLEGTNQRIGSRRKLSFSCEGEMFQQIFRI
jgi:hypothetical protein